MSNIRITKVSNLPQESFEKLHLPSFARSRRNYDDLPNQNTQGQGSSHLTMTVPPGLTFKKGLIPPVPEIQGAIIHCEGAIDKDKFKRFTSTTISPMEAAFHPDQEPYSLPSLIGLPIWMRPYNHDPDINRTNPAATWLHVIADIDSEGFGYTTKTWLDSAIVARSDRLTLLPQHLEVLSFYCRHVFEEVVGENVGSAGLSDDAGVRQNQKVTFRKLACKRGFMEFYETYCAQKSANDEAWRSLPSPYDGDALRGNKGRDGRGVAGVMASVEEDTVEREARRTSGRVTRTSVRGRESLMEPASEEEPRGRKRVRREVSDD